MATSACPPGSVIRSCGLNGSCYEGKSGSVFCLCDYGYVQSKVDLNAACQSESSFLRGMFKWYYFLELSVCAYTLERGTAVCLNRGACADTDT